MSRKFRPKAKSTRRAYSYHPTDSMRNEEIAAYRRLAVALVLVVLFSAGLYLWGIEIVAGLGSFWSRFFPNTSSSLQIGGSLLTPDVTLLSPNLDPLPLRTNQPEEIEVKGWAQSGAEVKVFVNGAEVGQVLVDNSGRFSYGDFVIEEGENTIYALTVENGRESKASEIQTVVYDKTKPELEVTVGETDAEKAEVQISGQTEGSAIVTVNNHRAIVDLNGNFSYTVTNLQEGENIIKVVATDEAGNEAVVEKVVDYSPAEPETPTTTD